jgi:hypothetical protein
MRGISIVAEKLITSQEELPSMELDAYSVFFGYETDI